MLSLTKIYGDYETHLLFLHGVLFMRYNISESLYHIGIGCPKMSVISVINLSFAYEGSYKKVFENVSFQIDTDWRLGFVGRNGRGKTTFLNLLLGKYEYSGTISASVPFEYFPYDVHDENRDTLLVMKQIAADCEDWEIIREISLLDVAEEVLYRPFRTLSHGEQTKTLLAAMFLTADRFLLIDEPTNHLDREARQAVSAYLKRKQGFILVSHDRSLLDECVDHMLSINKTTIDIQKGNFSSWWDNKLLQDQYELAENKKLQSDIRRLSKSARRSANWSDQVEKSKFGTTNSGSTIDRGYVGHKAAKAMKRAKNIEARQLDAIAEKSKLLHDIERNDALKLSPLPYRQHRLIEARDLSLFYDQITVCENLSFTICDSDRVALLGKNGSGKSSLLKLLCGENITYTGNLMIGGHLKISYIPQGISHLQGNLREYAFQNKIDETLFKTILRKLDLSKDQLEMNIEDFSGGQKKKVLVAGSLCEQAHLYIWDEPLNYIDIFSRLQIESLLLEYQPTILFVEHDRSFCDKIANKVIQL